MATPFKFKNFYSLFYKCFNGQNNPEVIRLITNMDEIPDSGIVSRVIRKGVSLPKSWCIPVLREGTEKIICRFNDMSDCDPRQLYVETLDDCIAEFISQMEKERYSDTKQILNAILSAMKIQSQNRTLREKVKLLNSVPSSTILAVLLQTALINELASKKQTDLEIQPQKEPKMEKQNPNKLHSDNVMDEEIPLNDSEFLNWAICQGEIAEVCMAFHVGADWWTNDSKRSVFLRLCNSPAVSIKVLSNPEYVSNSILENMKQTDKVYLKTDDILQVWNERSDRYSNLTHRVCSVPILHRMIIVRYRSGDGVCKISDYIYGKISREKLTRRIYKTTHSQYQIFLDEFLYLWQFASHENIGRTTERLVSQVTPNKNRKRNNKGYSLIQKHDYNYDYNFFEGEYFCYYYSIRNNGTILGGKLLLFKEDEKLKARLILGCQEDEQFDDLRLQTVLESSDEDIKQLFYDYRSKLYTKSRNIYYYYGDCSFNRNSIYIQFKTANTDCTSLFWGVSIPLDSNQVQYRGGLGIAVTKNGASLFRFFKIGFSRHRFSLHDKALEQHLKINLSTSPQLRNDENIMVREDEDVNWYRFIIDNENNI